MKSKKKVFMSPLIICSGGCDGCIDPDQPANAGLKSFVNVLEPLFKRYENVLTRWWEHTTRIKTLLPSCKNTDMKS